MDNIWLRSPGFLIRRVAHILHVRVNESLNSEGISHTAEEISILMVLDGLESPERAGALAELLGRDISTLTRQLDGLVKSGLVARNKCPNDGRAVVTTLTAKGRRLLKRITPVALGIRDRAMKGFSETDRTRLACYLSTMLENLKGDD